MNRIYVALDIETTGLKADREAIIEIGAVKFRGAEVLESWETLVNPGRPLPRKIQQLTGIVPDQLAAAPLLPAVAGRLYTFVKDHPLVGHNIAFDLGFLREHNIPLSNPTLDTFDLASLLMPYAARYNLGALASDLGIHFPEQHRALPDALATKDLFLSLFDLACQLDVKVIREINKLAAKSDWSLRQVFLDIEREAARHAFVPRSIGEQLKAKQGWGEDELLGLALSTRGEEERLAPAARGQDLDVDALAAMLEPGGLFATQFPGYEHRPQQVAMLKAVAQAFNRGEHLLVEAGTGVGKSIAYLIPAIHYAVANRRPVVISTNTINLQDQLVLKDLPDLRQILSLAFDVALVKGRTNYVCRRRLDNLRRQPRLSTPQVRALAKILAWLPTTATGDRAELTLVKGEEATWDEVCVEEETCTLEMCNFSQGGTCFFQRARERAARAHLIVVNHALLLADMVTENRVLPEYHHLIVDEAHHLEARATEQLGFEITSSRAEIALNEISPGGERPTGFLGEVLASLRGHAPTTIQHDLTGIVEEAARSVEAARRTIYPFFNALTQMMQSQGEAGSEYDQQVRLTAGFRAQPAWSNIEMLGDNLSLALRRVDDSLARLGRAWQDLADLDIASHQEHTFEIAARRQRVQELREQLLSVVAEVKPNLITWANVAADDGAVTLKAAPLHVGEILRRDLFDAKETLILTSATLRTDTGFAYLRERLGLVEARELALDSPFDFQRAALLYLPTDIPEPDTKDYMHTLHQTLIKLCQATQGRALVLFTSKNQLARAYEAIATPLEADDIVVFAQYVDGSRRQLLESFKTTPKAVLLGTRSFWEGIDVVGEALSCLAIARLPFPVPSDPVYEARSETFDNPFADYALPQAVLSFRQGFGRLIRSKSDRGVVVVLDRRIVTKTYGSAFLDALPPVTVRRGPARELPAVAARWLAEPAAVQKGLGL